MPSYVVAFDIDIRTMREHMVSQQGMPPAAFAYECTKLYRSEIPGALAACGTLRRKQRSLYHLQTEDGLEETIANLIRAIADQAPTFGRYARNLAIYPTGRGRDITPLLPDRK